MIDDKNYIAKNDLTNHDTHWKQQKTMNHIPLENISKAQTKNKNTIKVKQHALFCYRDDIPDTKTTANILEKNVY